MKSMFVSLFVEKFSQCMLSGDPCQEQLSTPRPSDLKTPLLWLPIAPKMLQAIHRAESEFFCDHF